MTQVDLIDDVGKRRVLDAAGVRRLSDAIEQALDALSAANEHVPAKAVKKHDAVMRELESASYRLRAAYMAPGAGKPSKGAKR